MSFLREYSQNLYLKNHKTNIIRKGIETFYHPSYGLNSIIAVLLQREFWHWITDKGWHTIKKKKYIKTFARMVQQFHLQVVFVFCFCFFFCFLFLFVACVFCFLFLFAACVFCFLFLFFASCCFLFVHLFVAFVFCFLFLFLLFIFCLLL